MASASSTHPLVTIGIPTYRRYDVLKTCVENALAQDYPNLEVLVSDNTQDEPPPGWLTELAQKDARLRYIRQPENLGPVGNGRFVRLNARGDYFCLMHDDDVFPTNYVSRLMTELLKSPSRALVAPVGKRYFDGEYTWEYDRYSNEGKGQLSRLLSIIKYAFSKPEAFEHFIFGLWHRDLLPANFDSRRVGNMIARFYILSAAGEVLTVDDLAIKKNINTAVLRRSEDPYETYSFLKPIRSGAVRKVLSIGYQLLKYTVTSRVITPLNKLILVFTISLAVPSRLLLLLALTVCKRFGCLPTPRRPGTPSGRAT